MQSWKKRYHNITYKEEEETNNFVFSQLHNCLHSYINTRCQSDTLFLYRCQISFAYCLTVLSDENFPADATFIKHLRPKASLSL